MDRRENNVELLTRVVRFLRDETRCSRVEYVLRRMNLSLRAPLPRPDARFVRVRRRKRRPLRPRGPFARGEHVRAEPRPALVLRRRQQGSSGPPLWGTIPGYELCSPPDGTRQSPIELLPAGLPARAPVLAFGKAPVKAWVNNGHSLETQFAPGPTLQVGGVTYRLVNVHFHVPAEHLVGAKQYDMEMHAVTQRDDTKAKAVFGVFFNLQRDAGPSLITRMLAEFTRNEHEHELCSRQAHDVTLDLRPLIPAGSPLWTYEGSLTVPTCDQNVTFYLAQRPLPVSQSDLDSFRARVGLPSTARPAQPRNGREVHETPAPTVSDGG